MALKTALIRCINAAFKPAQPFLSSVTTQTSQRCRLHNMITQRSLIAASASHFSVSPSMSNGFESYQNLLSSQSAVGTVPVRHYQSVLRPRLHCKGCYFVWRHGRKFVECSDVPSHKQMKKVLTRKLWKEDYTKGNVRNAMVWNRDQMRVGQRLCDKSTLSHNWLASRIGKDV